MNMPELGMKPFVSLVAAGEIDMPRLAEAAAEAAARKVPLSRILHRECGIPREALLRALAAHYRCRGIEYDERMPVPPELLRRAAAAGAAGEGWFPVAGTAAGEVMAAAADPAAPGLEEEVRAALGADGCELRVAMADDVSWFAQDLLHAPPGELIGTERTGLAYWRNTMAQWRTRMACYRTDLAAARTALSMGRAGLALTTIAETLLRSGKVLPWHWLPLVVLAMGMGLLVIAAPVYIRVRRSRMKPPGDQTLVEVTAATLTFLEDYHFPPGVARGGGPSKSTMLARLGDFLADHCTIIHPVPASRERTHLARERNVLAAQRTIAGCYRTIYARARTGLAFIRTGVSCASVGIGLLTHFGLGVNTPFDAILVLIGAALAADGLMWYLPVRREQAELPRSRSAVLAAAPARTPGSRG